MEEPDVRALCRRSRRKEISAARLPRVILVRVFRSLSMKDLAYVIRVCWRWKRICEAADEEIWASHLRRVLPESALTDPYLFANLPSCKDRIRAFKFAWNPADASRNVFVRTNGLTVHRQPIAQSTDGVRGKLGFSANSGAHSFEFCWEGPLGTHAVVGIATKHAALHCPGYLSLIGSDDQSWGWNLVDGTIVHNGENLGKYPRLLKNAPKYQIGERIRMILDSSRGYLYFEKGDEFYGLAFSDLPPVRLYPAICAVYGNTEVSMIYLGPPIVG